MRIKLSPRSVVVFSFLIAAIASTVGALVLNGAFPKLERAYGWMILLLAAGALLQGTVTLLVLRKRLSASRRLSQVVAQHGFTFIPHIDNPGFPGLPFRAGSNVHAFDLIDAQKSETPFLAGSLTGEYASDTSAPRTVGSSFIMIPLPKSVPNIVLMGKRLGILRQAGLSIVGKQKLSLEGDFDRHFTLYCPEGYERDALYIFAPDLMQLLIDTTAGCDVEFADNAMYVYSAPGRYRDGAAIENLVRVAERVQDKLRRQTGRYADDRSIAFTGAGASTLAAPGIAAAPRTVSPEDHAAGAGKVGADGQRLRTKTTVLQKFVTAATTLLLAAAVIYTVINYLPTLLNR